MTFNVLPGGGEQNALIAPPGTRITFNNAATPNGWTQDVTTPMSDCSMRIVNGTGGAQSGTTGWSAWNFGGTFSVNGFTIGVAQLPAHSHADAGHSHGVTDPAHSHTAISGLFFQSGSPSTIAQGSGGPAASANGMNNALTGISIQTGNANIQNTGSGATINPNYTTPQVKYTDFVMGVKA